MFLTVSQTGNAEYKEKKSKFIGQAYACSSELQAKEIIKNIRKKNPGCVHVCFAFRLGSTKQHFRYSDDGEPSNSAGAPIFGQIKSFNLTNVLITVVRYYGGTKLGVGGLIQAYKTAAKLAIENAVIMEDEDKEVFTLKFSYDKLPYVMNEIKSSNCLILKKDLQIDPKITISIPLSNEFLFKRLSKMHGVQISKKGH